MNNSPNHTNQTPTLDQKTSIIAHDATNQHPTPQQNSTNITNQTVSPPQKTYTVFKIILNIILLTIGVFFTAHGIREFINTISHPISGLILLPMATFYVILTLSGIIIIIKGLVLLFSRKKTNISPHA